MGCAPDVAEAMPPGADFWYNNLTPPFVVRGLMETLNAIKLGQPVDDPAREQLWDKAWQGNLVDYMSTLDINSLRPEYLTRDRPLRYQGHFIQPRSRELEAHYYTVVCRLLFQRYFANIDRVVEFGCGPGYALALLGKMFPEKTLVGCDWAESSQAILKLMAARGYRVQGRSFDLCRPDHDLELRGSGVFTALAMEQLGERWRPFLDYLLEQKPAICVHIEPMLELYEDNLFDFLAVQYHKARNYLSGFLPKILHLANTGDAQVLMSRRLHFGSFYHEPYSVLVWRPT